jgi:hypothetical protein
VIGHEIRRTRFGSDPNVLGRTVQLGTDDVTVVGIMREGFAFPVSHDMRTPPAFAKATADNLRPECERRLACQP